MFLNESYYGKVAEVMAIEKAFGIKFTSLEIMKWKNVGEMVNTMEEKIK